MGEEIWFSMAGEKAVAQTGTEFSDMTHKRVFSSYILQHTLLSNASIMAFTENEEEVKRTR